MKKRIISVLTAMAIVSAITATSAFAAPASYYSINGGDGGPGVSTALFIGGNGSANGGNASGTDNSRD